MPVAPASAFGMSRVMLVEDDANERFALTRLLEHAGYEVTSVTRGDDVIAQLTASPYDAVVTDMMMPGIDGLTLARSVADHFPGLPIVVTSGFHLPRSQLERLHITALHFLEKPIDLSRLMALLPTPHAAPPPR